MLDTLIFDFDGVIIDTETPDYGTWQEVFNSYGVDLDRAYWSRLIGGGRNRFDVYEHLEELAGVELDRDAVGHARRQRYESLVHASPLLPGVYEYLEEASGMGLKLGIASSSQRAWVQGHLEVRGLMPYFGSVVTRDEVAKVKPDPEGYVAAMGQLGTTPDRAVAIEDSLNGVTAAKRAGMRCVAVPNPMTADMDLAAADHRLGALSEMGLGTLLDRLS